MCLCFRVYSIDDGVENPEPAFGMAGAQVGTEFLVKLELSRGLSRAVMRHHTRISSVDLEKEFMLPTSVGIQDEERDVAGGSSGKHKC